MSRGGRRRSLAETDRPPPVVAPSGGSTGGFWTGGSGSKSSGGGAGRPLPRLPSPANSARLSVPKISEEAATAAAAASAGTSGGSRVEGGGGGGGAEGVASVPSPPRELSSTASGLSTSLSSVTPGDFQSTDLDVYGRGDDAVFGPGAAVATQYEAAAALEATRRRTSVVGAGEHVDRDGWGRGDSIIFGRGASTIAARDAAAAYRRVQRRSARRGFIVPAATLIEGRWRRELRPGRWIGSRPASAETAVDGLAGRVGGGSAAADATASSAATTSLRAGLSRSSGSIVASAGTRTSLDMGGDDHFIPVTASGNYLDRTDEPRSLSRGITGSSTGSTLVFPAAEVPSVGGVDEPPTADLFDSDDMALLATYGRRRGGGSEGGSSGALWGAGGRRTSGSTEEPSTSELLRDETGLEAAAAVAAREAAAARGEEYDEGIGGINGTGGATGIASRTAPVVAEGGAYGVRIYLDGGADSDSDSSSGVDPPVEGGRREYSPAVEALLFGDDSDNDGDVEESVQGGGGGGLRDGAASGSNFQGATGSGGGARRRSTATNDSARNMIDNDVGEDNWPLGESGEIYAGTTGEYETEGSQGGATAGMGATDEWTGDTAGIVGGGHHAGASDGTSPSSREGAVTETATMVAAAATAAAAAASTASAVGSSPDGWGSEADDAPSSSARFASASTDLSVPGAGVFADGESDADALRAPEDEQAGEDGGEGGWSPLASVPSAGNDHTDDGAADPDAVTASPLGDIPEPVEAIVPEPLLETPCREGATSSGAADGDMPASPPTGSSLSAMPAADHDASGASPQSILAAPSAEQLPVATPGDGDGEAGDGPAQPPPSRLAAAAAKVGSKATAGVAAAGSALAAVAGLATGRGGEPTTEADAEAVHSDAPGGDGAPVECDAGDDPAQQTPSRLAAAAATVGSKATAGVVAAGSALSAVAGMATGRGAEPTAEVDDEAASSDEPGTAGAEVAGRDPEDGATDTGMTSDFGEAPWAAETTDGAAAAPLAGQAIVDSEPATAPLVERATESATEPADEPAAEPIAQTAAQPGSGLATAEPVTVLAAVDSTATLAVDRAAEPDAAPVTAAARDAFAAPVTAPAAAASRPTEVPAATRSSPAPAPASADAPAVEGAAAGAEPVAANEGGDSAVASPAAAVKAAAAAAVLPAGEDALADSPSEAADEDYELTDADVASDDDFTAEGPSTGSWAGITAPTFSAVTPASAIPTTVTATVGGASAVATAAAAASIATADPASATEPDEADDYTTAIDGWDDSLVLTRGGGGSRGSRIVHFGREPASNATSATDDDARYYDARLELP